MELDGTRMPGGCRIETGVAIVGGGPAGIVLALELARAGHDVVLIESGGARLDRKAQRLGKPATGGDAYHRPASVATRRQLGGASVMWGGRCVPFDPVDFEPRDHVGARWPVGYDELVGHYPAACRYLACGQSAFEAGDIAELSERTLVPGLPDGDVRTSSLERWSLPTNFGRRYRKHLRQAARIRVVLHQTCTRVVLSDDGSRMERLETRTLDGRSASVVARHYVLACGGLETTRLLMASGVGNHSGHLGRWYMAHPQGSIAHVRFTTPPADTIYGHEQDADGVYVRRRFTFSRSFLLEQALPNFAGWLVNPELADPRHSNGFLSLVYLALASPAGALFASQSIRLAHLETSHDNDARDHLRNLRRDLVGAARFATAFGYRRYLRRGRRAPGFSTYNADNRYRLQYQGEHLPHWESRVTLDQRVDPLGVPLLRTQLKFGQADVDGVIDAHRHIDDYLRHHGLGQLEYTTGDLEASVRDQLFAGCHQAGTTRMSERPEDGVVDGNLAVHGVPNLHVASSSAFVTSSHANSTFMILVLALRLAGHLSREPATTTRARP